MSTVPLSAPGWCYPTPSSCTQLILAQPKPVYLHLDTPEGDAHELFHMCWLIATLYRHQPVCVHGLLPGVGLYLRTELKPRLDLWQLARAEWPYVRDLAMSLLGPRPLPPRRALILPATDGWLVCTRIARLPAGVVEIVRGRPSDGQIRRRLGHGKR